MKFRYLHTTVLLAMLLICSNMMVAQQGFFRTWQDFKANRIIASDEISLNHLLSGKCIDIKAKETTTQLCKDSIFGYRDSKGDNYRFYKEYNDEYQILEDHDMVIYVIYKPTHTSKGITEPFIPYYYFSTSLNANIMQLTIPNLIDAYPENHKFHHELEDKFKNNNPASTYDEQHHMFLVNYILSQTLMN